MVPDLSVKLFVQVFILRLCYFQPPFCGDSRKKTIDKAGWFFFFSFVKYFLDKQLVFYNVIIMNNMEGTMR